MGTLKVGRYALEKLLGEGGMGSVFEGRSLDTKEPVAVKIINGDVAAHTNVLARFEIEARAAAAIQSPHVARVLDFGREEGAPFLVMELLRGKDLETLFAELKILSPALCARFGLQCCRGLARAHERGIVHRDIKPANLMLAEREGSDEITLKILDFGIAKVRADEWQALSEEPLTRTGSLLGSPRYMSPEQARGYKTIDQRSDLFSLAVVMYQGLTGHTPHHRVEAMGDLIVTLCSDPAPPLRESAPWVDERLERVVMKALSIQVSDRYATAEEMAEDLEVLCRDDRGIRRSLLEPFDPGSIADTQRTPPPVSSWLSGGARASEATPPPHVAASPTEPEATKTTTPMPKDEAKSARAEDEGLDLDSIPLTWVGAGIALSLVIGIGGVAAGIIPLPSANKDAASATASAGALDPPAGGDTLKPTTAHPIAAPSATVAAASSASSAAPATSAASESASASASAGSAAAPEPSAKPALSGRLPVAPPTSPPSESTGSLPYEPSPSPPPTTTHAGSPPPSAPPTTTPPSTPAPLPPDSPL